MIRNIKSSQTKLDQAFPLPRTLSHTREQTRVGGFCWEVIEDHGRSSGSGREAGKLGKVVL
nr:hypothetical protein [Tanacetum cinerariifolium]